MIKNKHKLLVFIGVLFTTFLLYLFLRFKEYDYEIEYIVNQFEVIESYNKETKYYEFLIKNKDITYPYQIKQKYLRKKELISNIEVFESDEEVCILPKSINITFYPLCSNEDKIYSYHFSKITDVTYKYKELTSKKETFKNVEINNLNNNSFLIYNYKGFYLINENQHKEIKIFDEDVYSINLVYQKDNYLIIPDYNQKHFFDNLFIIDIYSGKIKNIKLEHEISFESEFLGEFKNNIYLLDKKEEKQYKINIKQENIKEVPLQLIKNGKLTKVTYQKIVNNNYKFSNYDIIEYKIIDDYLYRIIHNIKIKISDKKVDKIVKYENDTIYYLSGENLYMYNNVYGETKLLSYFEWNFNNTNVIFFSK